MKKKTSTKAPDGISVAKEFTFKLNDEELRTMSAKCASLHINVIETENSFKEVKRDWTDRLNKMNAEEDALQKAIHAQEETRVVDAIMTKDYNEKEIAYWFPIEGEWTKIESRTMTVEETQMEMGEAKGIARAAKKHPKPEKKEQTEQEEIGEVIKMETGKRTKRSAVDGAVDF